MTETVVKRTRLPKTSKTIKQINTEVSKPVEKKVKTTTSVQEKKIIVSKTKIKRVLDNYYINKDIIEVIEKIKTIIKEKKEVKKVLTDSELDVVSIYLNKNRKRIEENSNKGKNTSANDLALSAFLDKKYKFRKDLLTYLASVCDLICEEIITTAITHVVSINKKYVNTSHLVREELSKNKLYPLYCNLPTFVNQLEYNERSSELTEDMNTEEVEDESTDKLFIGNIRTLFLQLKSGNTTLKIQKKFQVFMSKLIMEFLGRVSHPLLVIVRNNLKNRSIVKNTIETVIEILLNDYHLDNSKYDDIKMLINSKLDN